MTTTEQAHVNAPVSRDQIQRMMADMTLADLLDFRWTLKERSDALKASIAVRIDNYAELMRAAEIEVRKKLGEDSQSFSSPRRNVHYRIGWKASIADAPVFYGSLADRIRRGELPQAVFAAMEARVKTSYVTDYIEANGKPPPGTNAVSERVLVFR